MYSIFAETSLMFQIDMRREEKKTIRHLGLASRVLRTSDVGRSNPDGVKSFYMCPPHVYFPPGKLVFRRVRAYMGNCRMPTSSNMRDAPFHDTAVSKVYISKVISSSLQHTTVVYQTCRFHHWCVCCRLHNLRVPLSALQEFGKVFGEKRVITIQQECTAHDAVCHCGGARVQRPLRLVRII